MSSVGARGVLASSLTLLLVGWGGGASPVPAALRAPAPPLAAQPPAVAATGPPGSCPANDLPPVVRRIPTNEPVAFITMDDGYHRDPRILEALRGLDPTLFIPGAVLRRDPVYWRAALGVGATFENHTQTHPRLDYETFDAQLTDILGGSAAQQAVIGTTPTYFRPPFGGMNAVTTLAASAAGLRVVLLWSIQIRTGRVDVRRALRPGDVVLIHFTPTSLADIALARRMLAEAGLGPAHLPECL